MSYTPSSNMFSIVEEANPEMPTTSSHDFAHNGAAKSATTGFKATHLVMTEMEEHGCFRRTPTSRHLRTPAVGSLSEAELLEILRENSGRVPGKARASREPPAPLWEPTSILETSWPQNEGLANGTTQSSTNTVSRVASVVSDVVSSLGDLFSSNQGGVRRSRQIPELTKLVDSFVSLPGELAAAMVAKYRNQAAGDTIDDDVRHEWEAQLLSLEIQQGFPLDG